MSCAILVLGNEIEFHFLTECPNSFKDRAGNLFTRYYLENDNGFYDWLRSAEGDVIGVRWFPYENDALKKCASYIKDLKNITINEDFLEISIQFFEPRSINESRSRDQDFLENNIYISKLGRCAISFSINNLSDKERFLLPGYIEI